MARLMQRFEQEIHGALVGELAIKNRHAVPRLQKVVVSMGVGRAVQEKKRMESAVAGLTRITGQKPVICKAKKSVSNFKVREGYEIGAKVTLRGTRMYEFVDRLISVAVPRTRDFRGLSQAAFDGRGNYSMGISDETIFPEIDIDKIETLQGMNVTFVTTAKTDDHARQLLTMLGMPRPSEVQGRRTARHIRRFRERATRQQADVVGRAGRGRGRSCAVPASADGGERSAHGTPDDRDTDPRRSTQGGPRSCTSRAHGLPVAGRRPVQGDVAGPWLQRSCPSGGGDLRRARWAHAHPQEPGLACRQVSTGGQRRGLVQPWLRLGRSVHQRLHGRLG